MHVTLNRRARYESPSSVHFVGPGDLGGQGGYRNSGQSGSSTFRGCFSRRCHSQSPPCVRIAMAREWVLGQAHVNPCNAVLCWYSVDVVPGRAGPVVGKKSGNQEGRRSPIATFSHAPPACQSFLSTQEHLYTEYVRISVVKRASASNIDRRVLRGFVPRSGALIGCGRYLSRFMLQGHGWHPPPAATVRSNRQSVSARPIDC